MQLAIAQGRFQKPSGRPLSAAILDVALDVAAAMAALHARAAPHGNLCSASVLLAPSSVQLSFSISLPGLAYHALPCEGTKSRLEFSSMPCPVRMHLRFSPRLTCVFKADRSQAC